MALASERISPMFHNEASSKSKEPQTVQFELDELTTTCILCGLAHTGQLEKLQQMVEERNSDISCTDYDGRSPLHLASEGGHIQVVKYLLAKGAAINTADRFGNTPLKCALERGHTSIAEILQKHGGFIIEPRVQTEKYKIEEAKECLSKFVDPTTNTVAVSSLKQFLKKERGLSLPQHPRLQAELHKINNGGPSGSIPWDTLCKIIEDESDNSTVPFLQRALRNDLKIPEWKAFIETVKTIYEQVKEECPASNGNNASYIAELASVEPELFAVSVMTVDGQQISFGDYHVPFTLQACGNPLLYGITSESIGEEQLHEYVGREPSSNNFTGFSLNADNKPHNPLINSGAIMTCSLFHPTENISKRFGALHKAVSELAGGRKIDFSQSVYLAERDAAYCNYALAHYMKSQQSFPSETDIMAATDLYLQACSLELDAFVLACIGASYANNGVCPVTGQRVLTHETVRNTLQLMYNCGMYSFSGEWACTIGIPAKCGLSGALFMVIPNSMAVCVWSPPLDKIGNSCRGVEFCSRFAQRFKLNIFDALFG